MLNLVICEDEEITRKRIENNLSEISIKLDIDIKVVLSTGNPFNAYEYIKNNKIDVLILDIDFKNKEMDGIELGNKLRTLDTNVIIVFVSSRIERTWEAFSCIPFNFITKPAIKVQLEETFQRILDNKIYVPHGHFVQIRNKTINLDEIIYIEKQLTKAIFHSNLGTFELYISFVQLLDCLTDNFIQVSKSFIVNSAYIIDINHTTKFITLNNGHTVKYSKKYLQNMEVLFDDFDNNSANN